MSILLWLVASCVWADTKTVGISTWNEYPTSVEGFIKGLALGGFIEGKNITLIRRSSGADKDKQHRIAEEFKNLKVDLVYSLTTPGTVIIKNDLPPSIPIVFSIVTYPADSGLIESYDYSGNNLVGTSNFVPQHNFVKLLRTLLPNAKRASVFHRSGEPNSKLQAVNLKRLLGRDGIDVIDVEVSTLDEVERVALSHKGKTDVFITTTDTLMQGGGERRLIKVGNKLNMPIMSSNKKGIELGSSFGPVADFRVLGEISGRLAASILSGKARPSDLASSVMETPLILVNRKSIEALNISIPNDMANVSYVD
ncbi:hypothetical protein A9Q99_07830 [Gammaproteobacteria bacterium 45_16_T64]|nr:hypothetical protein A9Q99_07830 [Gammaproteobacteria bacterium 45_16_T64]